MRPRKPCGKLCLAEHKAKAIVLAAGYFRHNLWRQERRAYYCRPCRAWHTTSH